MSTVTLDQMGLSCTSCVCVLLCVCLLACLCNPHVQLGKDQKLTQRVQIPVDS